jgi:hypothetical protein
MRIFRCIALIAFSSVFSNQVFAQNLITNGGFETSGAGWNLYIADTVGFAATVTYPTTGAAEGTVYAHVNVTKATVTDPASDNWKAQLQFPKWTAVKNANYKLSFKAKSSATAMKVGISRGGSYAYFNGYDFTLTTAWQTYSCMFTSDTAGNGQLLLNFYVGAAVGTYDFDSVNLVQTGTNAPTSSLISNGGFETAGNGLYVQTENMAAATVSYPTTGAAEGTTYGSVNVTAASDPSQVQLQLPLFTADSNAAYAVSFKARGAGDIQVVSQYDATRGYAAVQSFYQTLTNAWASYVDTFSCNVSGSGALRINFWLGTMGTYDFDAVSVVKTTGVGVKNTSGNAFVPGKLTARKLANGMAVSAIGPLSHGRFSLGVYSPDGRMIKTVLGSRQSAGAIFVPMNMKRGTYIIRFTDAQGTIVKKLCWM